MTDIAQAAGVTKPVLYQHFSSKRDLYAELLTDVSNQLQDTIDKAVTAAESPREMVEQGFAAYFRFVNAHRSAFQLFLASDSWRDEEFSSLVHAVETSMAEQVANFIEIEGLSADQSRLLGHGIVGMAEAASRHWLLSQDSTDPDQLARRLADLAWRGLRGVRA